MSVWSRCVFGVVQERDQIGLVLDQAEAVMFRQFGLIADDHAIGIQPQRVASSLQVEREQKRGFAEGRTIA